MPAKKSRAKNAGEATTPDGPDPRLARLQELVHILESSSLAELKYEDQDISVGLKRHTASTTVIAQAAPAIVPAPSSPPMLISPPEPKALPSPSPAQSAPKPSGETHVVRSPFVGTFYSSPSPGATAFVEVGKRVRRGQTLCIIEAMKLMNEIESEVDGVVLEIVPQNGSAVQYGDALLHIQVKPA